MSKFVSDCCKASVKYEEWVEIEGGYVGEGHYEPHEIIYETWICSKCHKPCKRIEIKENGKS